MTRPDIDAALERWERIPDYPDQYAEEKTEAGNELARLLRAADQPAELSNNPGELPAPAARCPTCRGWGIIGSERAAIEGSADSDDAPCPDCDPAPAAGEIESRAPASPGPAA